MYIGLSPAYAVRNERTSSYLIRVDTIIDMQRSEFGAFCVPPFIGYILSQIGTAPYDVAIEKIAGQLGVSKSSVEFFVQQLVDNAEPREFKLDSGKSIVFPKGLFIKSNQPIHSNIHDEKEFKGTNDFIISRPHAPISVNLMVTTRCNTDCVYCYANRKLRPLLSTSKLLDIVRELHEIGTINLTLTGGDIFAQPDWKEILTEVRKCNYKPFLSTKTPLDRDDVQFLIDLGYEEIQFSLDSTDRETEHDLVRSAPDYLDKVASFFETCSELELRVLVRSVLTKINSSISRIEEMHRFLSQHQCVKEWIMTPAFFSKYKADQSERLSPRNEDLVRIYKFTQNTSSPFKIGLNKIGDNGYVLKRNENVESFVVNNQICLANTTSLSILANGDCSVCEMLYDTEGYLLGNINQRSVSEIWNSEKALNLYHLKQSVIDTVSPCHSCSVFDKCRNGFGKRICYLDITKIGKSKDFPDPRCPMSENINIIL